jgi:hypothetical protein|nr:MAG TPA: deoxyribosyltransferase [Caudoviricetes sp.]
MAKKKLYISLPITGHPIDEVKKQAETYKNLWCKKYKVITPFDICPDQDKSYSHYMGKDIEALLECDLIYMSPGWVHSKGCNAEYQIAKIYGIKILG